MPPYSYPRAVLSGLQALTPDRLRGRSQGGVLATRNSSVIRLFLYNHPVLSATTGQACAMSVQLPSGVAGSALEHATLARIDDTHTNPKAKWQALGEPEYPSAADLAELETASEVVWGALKVEARLTDDSSGGAQFELSVPANGLAVVDLPAA